MRFQSFFISLCVVSVLLVMLIPGVNADTPEYTFQWAVPPLGGFMNPRGLLMILPAIFMPPMR